jgi:hypothetical protein
VELARLREQPIAEIAKDLVISESCLRRWTDLARPCAHCMSITIQWPLSSRSDCR